MTSIEERLDQELARTRANMRNHRVLLQDSVNTHVGKALGSRPYVLLGGGLAAGYLVGPRAARRGVSGAASIGSSLTWLARTLLLRQIAKVNSDEA